MISHANSYDSIACSHGKHGKVPWLMHGSSVEARLHAARVVAQEVDPVDTCLRVSFMATYMDSSILFGLILFNRFAHSAGPGMVRHRVELTGSGFDGQMQSSKRQSCCHSM